MSDTRAQLQALLESKVLSGSRSTTAANLRLTITALIESLLNILDDKDQDDGYLGIDSNGRVDESKINSASPIGGFLRDDGQFSLCSGSTAPAVTKGAGAGASGADPVVTGTDDAGSLEITTGTGCSQNANIIEVTFSSGFIFPNGCFAVLTPADDDTPENGGLLVYTVGTTNGFVIKSSGTTPLTDATTYKWNYVVKGY